MISNGTFLSMSLVDFAGIISLPSPLGLPSCIEADLFSTVVILSIDIKKVAQRRQ